ncbi:MULTISPECIES: MFS transporter [Streptomyces]|uniref:Transmembrane efflux protein n=2 Tax=Streptomyces TaxID=1883 RepID=Q9RD97_STRCO|nr:MULTISPECIES: MFS transporter [Streptomyces]WOZ00328.1 MFS transporter [Streptomyces violaceoruber]MDX2925809.1 MFS transporter [Streptomyces sp. NRRL_B-16638]MYU42381.1 MFS transporter [Streptomyces sp. SID7813]NSL82410.1 MFS transporter [Streptomyces coelicolor]QFI42954.1 MFS transporter [Streptomyces coelicolor A3(2)]
MTETGTDSPTTPTAPPTGTPATTAAAAPPPDRALPPPHPGRTLALTSAATAVALMAFTAPMVTLPETAADLHTSLSAQAWLLNGTPLGLAALLLVAGSLADDYGRRRLFVSGTLALGVTTVLGAFASTTWLFTLARVAQGAASAALLASSLGLLVHAFPTPAGRLRATGVWGAFVSGGIAVGPVLVGAIPDWRVAHGVLGAAALVVAGLGARALSESRSPREGRPDFAGALTFGPALVALVAALTLGRDGWLRAPVGLLLAAAVLLGALFVVLERRAATPMIDLSLLRRPLFLASSAGGLFTGLSVIGLFSFLPTVLQRALGLSPLDTALLSLLWAGLAFAVALQVRRIAHRVSPRHQLVVGFALHAVGVLTMLGAVGAGSWARLLPGLVVAGVGSGLLNAALPLLAVESVPAARAAMGSGAQQTFRYIGSCAGVALTIAIATSAGSPGAGTDVALWVSAGLAVAAGVLVATLRERH